MIIWFLTTCLTTTCVTNLNFENVTLIYYNNLFKSYSTIKVQFEQNLIPQTLIQILKTFKNFKFPKWNSFGNVGTSSLPFPCALPHTFVGVLLCQIISRSHFWFVFVGMPQLWWWHWPPLIETCCLKFWVIIVSYNFGCPF